MANSDSFNSKFKIHISLKTQRKLSDIIPMNFTSKKADEVVDTNVYENNEINSYLEFDYILN